MTHTRGVGTRGYMALKVIKSRIYNEKSDIYSIYLIGMYLINSNDEE